MLLLVLCAALLAGLWLERRRLDRSRDAVALRIAVTGTRGKTSVARMLASVLREDGRSVLAKTTGSEPCLILPDGAVEPIRRRGPASILEQKALLHRAADLRVDAVVAEVMSIHAENHRVEGRRILLPQVVLVTNFRVDHPEAQGTTRAEVTAVLAEAVPDGATVLVPGSECTAAFRAAVARRGGTVVEVPRGLGASMLHGAPGPLHFFEENADLVAAAGRLLGAGDGAIRRGMGRAQQDRGAFAMWKLRAGEEAAPTWLVSAFAANEPESTALAWERACRRVPAAAGHVGLLCLRRDRGDRSLQWADALAGGLLERFDRLVVVGMHARALAHRVRRVRRRSGGEERPLVALGRAGAAELTHRLVRELGPAGGVVFGFGNFGGTGEELVRHWSLLGEAVDHGC